MHHIIADRMADDYNDGIDDCPDLVSAEEKKIPVTIITGFLGTLYNTLRIRKDRLYMAY